MVEERITKEPRGCVTAPFVEHVRRSTCARGRADEDDVGCTRRLQDRRCMHVCNDAHVRVLGVRYPGRVRTTIEFDPDTAKLVERVRAERGRGVSDAVNELIRRAALAPTDRSPFVPRVHPLGLVIDVSNVADALDLLEGPEAR